MFERQRGEDMRKASDRVEDWEIENGFKKSVTPEKMIQTLNEFDRNHFTTHLFCIQKPKFFLPLSVLRVSNELRLLFAGAESTSSLLCGVDSEIQRHTHTQSLSCVELNQSLSI